MLDWVSVFFFLKKLGTGQWFNWLEGMAVKMAVRAFLFDSERLASVVVHSDWTHEPLILLCRLPFFFYSSENWLEGMAVQMAFRAFLFELGRLASVVVHSDRTHNPLILLCFSENWVEGMAGQWFDWFFLFEVLFCFVFFRVFMWACLNLSAMWNKLKIHGDRVPHDQKENTIN